MCMSNMFQEANLSEKACVKSKHQHKYMFSNSRNPESIFNKKCQQKINLVTAKNLRSIENKLNLWSAYRLKKVINSHFFTWPAACIRWKMSSYNKFKWNIHMFMFCTIFSHMHSMLLLVSTTVAVTVIVSKHDMLFHNRLYILHHTYECHVKIAQHKNSLLSSTVLSFIHWQKSNDWITDDCCRQWMPAPIHVQ